MTMRLRPPSVITPSKITPLAAGIAGAAGILGVGYVDYVTGIEIRIFPLYFLPLMFAAWHTEKIPALVLSLLAAVSWICSMYFGGREYSHSYIWAINFFTQGSTFVIVTVLFSHIRKLLAQERASSRTDGLTGLNNSRSFYEQVSLLLKLCQRKKRPITLAYVDLDNFKHANDSMGHLYGDELLCKVAKVFRTNLRASDIAARMGGDEFAIMLPEASAADAQTALNKILTRIVQTPQLKACSVTASIGAVSYPVPPDDIEQMVRAADELMYKVKKTCKNKLLIESMP